MTIGLGNLLGNAVADIDASPAIASFIVLCATVLIFVSDQYLQIIEGLFASYGTMPISGGAETASMAKFYLQALEQSFLLALRISSPFLLFGLVTNFGFRTVEPNGSASSRLFCVGAILDRARPLPAG